ncbi:MAG TPA: hypothetical protein VFZ46_05580 [Nitrososphaeraceae archaeon]
MSEKESDYSKSLKNKEMKEENIENRNEDISSNMKLLNDKFNTMCLNYVQSISDVQKECFEIIENNVKANKRLQEKWLFSGKTDDDYYDTSSDILKRYLNQLVIQLNDATETMTKINEISNNLTSTTLEAIKDNLYNYSKIFVANQDLCTKFTKNWISTFTYTKK